MEKNTNFTDKYFVDFPSVRRTIARKAANGTLKEAVQRHRALTESAGPAVYLVYFRFWDNDEVPYSFEAVDTDFNVATRDYVAAAIDWATTYPEPGTDLSLVKLTAKDGAEAKALLNTFNNAKSDKGYGAACAKLEEIEESEDGLDTYATLEYDGLEDILASKYVAINGGSEDDAYDALSNSTERKKIAKTLKWSDF